MLVGGLFVARETARDEAGANAAAGHTLQWFIPAVDCCLVLRTGVD